MNLLIGIERDQFNPIHQDFQRIRYDAPERYVFDLRLFFKRILMHPSHPIMPGQLPESDSPRNITGSFLPVEEIPG
jgi:hypothetical protein